MALLSPRTERVPTEEERDAALARAQFDERPARRRFAPSSTADTVTTTPDEVTGPRPRASMLATFALVLGVVAVLAVFTGLLAGPGVAVGLLALVLGIGGIAATGRRHVAGKGDALLGVTLGLGSVVLGVLVLTGMIPWMDGESNMVMSARDWLASYLPWLFPST